VRRTTALLGGTLAATLALSACGSDGGGGGGADGGGGGGMAGEITVWIMDPGNPEVQQIIDETGTAFEAEHSDATVNIEYVPWTSAHDQFVTAIGGGQVPDLAEMGTTWTPEFASLGAFAPIEQAGEAEYVESLVDSGTVDDTAYGYPWYAGARSLIYRTDVLEKAGVEAPQTWADIISAGQAIEDSGQNIAPMHVAGDNVHALAPLIWGAGGDIAVEEGDTWQATVDSEAGRAAFEFYAELWNQGWTPDGAVQWTSVEIRDAFANGQSAMMIGGGWDLAGVLAASPELKGKLGTALMPAGPADNQDAFAGGSHLTVFEGSDNKELAHAFAQFMLQPQHLTKFTEQIGFLPGTVEGVEASVGDDELYGTFATQLVEHSRSYPPAAWWGKVEGDRVFQNEVQRMMQGDQSPQEAAAAVDEQIAGAIESAG